MVILFMLINRSRSFQYLLVQKNSRASSSTSSLAAIISSRIKKWTNYNFSMTINGEAVVTSKTVPVICPATGKPFATCPIADSDHLGTAIDGAADAFTRWKRTSMDERRAVMEEMASILEENKDELGELLSLENGKPLAEGIKEAGPRTCASLLGFSKMDIPVDVLVDNDVQRVEVKRLPYGVIGCIIPWNFPLHTLFQKVAPAIYAGNACIVKPSSATPLSTLRAMELLRDVCPRGLIQTLAGPSSLGREICKHPGIAKISFTGSTNAGIDVARSSVDTLKRLNLELGGNDAAIVLDDVDVNDVANGLANAAFANSGQVCHALKRLYVHESIYEDMITALENEVKDYRVGNPLDNGVTHGPLTTKEQFEYVSELVDEAIKQGAKVVCGGKKALRTSGLDEGGYYYPPTILAVNGDIRAAQRIVNEEQFGPVLPVIPFADPYDAVDLANESEMGLTGSVWTKNEALGYELASNLDCGTAFVNHMSSSHGTTSSVNWPSQGYKMTGMGCNRGLLGLLEYTQPQTVNQRKITAASR